MTGREKTNVPYATMIISLIADRLVKAMVLHPYLLNCMCCLPFRSRTDSKAQGIYFWRSMAAQQES